MKKKIAALVLMGAMVFTAAACGAEEDNYGGSDGAETGEAAAPSGYISVTSREDGSGTRGAFVEIFGIEEEDESGEKVDNTTEDSAITNSTSVMMTSVAGDPQAIGYISLGSLNDTVKAVKIDGAEATAENVKNESYKVSRPFNIAVSESASETAKDFVDYILSAEGQEIVEENNCIAAVENAPEYAGSKPEGKAVVAGSSSVVPVMEKLKEGYEAVNGNAEIEIQQSDSTTGIESAISGICDIGMASRELKDSETAEGLEAQKIAVDGIAVIVNNENAIEELTSAQVKDIYTGAVTDWEELQ